MTFEEAGKALLDALVRQAKVERENANPEDTQWRRDTRADIYESHTFRVKDLARERAEHRDTPPAWTSRERKGAFFNGTRIVQVGTIEKHTTHFKSAYGEELE